MGYLIWWFLWWGNSKEKLELLIISCFWLPTHNPVSTWSYGFPAWLKSPCGWRVISWSGLCDYWRRNSNDLFRNEGWRSGSPELESGNRCQDLIPLDVNVHEEYGISRSFGWGATSGQGQRGGFRGQRILIWLIVGEILKMPEEKDQGKTCGTTTQVSVWWCQLWFSSQMLYYQGGGYATKVMCCSCLGCSCWNSLFRKYLPIIIQFRFDLLTMIGSDIKTAVAMARSFQPTLQLGVFPNPLPPAEDLCLMFDVWCFWINGSLYGQGIMMYNI